MLAFCMCIVLIVLETNAENHSSDNPVVVFNISMQGNGDVLKYTVVKNKPLEIILLNFYPYSAQCWSFYANTINKMFLNKVFNGFEPNKIMRVQNITDEMSTKWKCLISTNCLKDYVGRIYNCEAFDAYFNIHVKGANKVSFTINDQRLEPAISSQPTTKLDGEIIHEYLDGQLIILSCKTDIGTKSLKYYDAQGSLIFQTDEMSLAPTFRSVLTARNNYYYIECERYTTSPSETYYYRLTFVLREPVPKYDDEVNVSVNGITLAPTRSDLGNTRCYNYYYEYGFDSTLNVTCHSNIYENGRMGLENPNGRGLEVPVTTRPSLMQTSLATKKLNKSTLICKYTNIDGSVVLARLRLKSADVLDTKIIGLPEDNLEYQYSKNYSFYSMHYRYSFNEIIQLTCVTTYANIEKIVWNYNNKSTIFTPEQNNTFFGKSATLQFTLTAEYNATSIQCNTFDAYGFKAHTVDVFLDLDPNSVIPTSLIAGEDARFIIIGCSAVMVVIITVICAFCWCTRPRKKIIEDNYENLSNDSTIQAYPISCENTYEDPEKVIQPIRPSEAPSEAHYSEIDYFFINQLPIYTNNENCEIINDSYDHLDHNIKENSCRINSDNSVVFRNKNDYVNKNCLESHTSDVTYKNNSIYSSRNGESSNFVINDDHGETEIY